MRMSCHLNSRRLTPRSFNSRRFCRVAGSAIGLLALAACADLPPDYSPHFVQVPVVSPTRPDRVVRYELVPESCLVPDPTDTQLGPRLPPGCANNANLLAMVEQKRDVVHGRKLGAAPAAPSARAAQRYIYGTRGQLGAGVAPLVPGVAPAAVTTEPVPTPTR
jgi:hypothetical protein